MYVISFVKIRRSLHRLIFIMGTLIPIKRHLFIKTTPDILINPAFTRKDLTLKRTHAHANLPMLGIWTAISQRYSTGSSEDPGSTPLLVRRDHRVTLVHVVFIAFWLPFVGMASGYIDYVWIIWLTAPRNGKLSDCRFDSLWRTVVTARVPFKYKDHLSGHGNFHYKDKRVVGLVYLYSGNSCIGKMACLYLNRPQAVIVASSSVGGWHLTVSNRHLDMWSNLHCVILAHIMFFPTRVCGRIIRWMVVNN